MGSDSEELNRDCVCLEMFKWRQLESRIFISIKASSAAVLCNCPTVR